MYVIYEHPRDFPGMFVMRRSFLKRPGEAIGPELAPFGTYPSEDPCREVARDVSLAVTLEEIRRALPHGLVRIGRFAADDACIVEVWI